ncbi:hypothetical protein DPMN_060241 [Dreissena polymorpha]|uniref:Uncharacterized protein n=1 Tax=Dreissena polymorpha TaxID=45954 RepID=A0A9D4HHD5_DREPO|nr:hypothetical protein DPMN_060241 [Dreissena polymorpha]
MDGKTSHRPDAVLSMLDWALQNCESDADTCSIHAPPFLELYFKPVTGIMQYQYFRFDQSKPGIVTAKIQHDGEEKELKNLKNPTFRFQNVERPHSTQFPLLD